MDEVCSYVYIRVVLYDRETICNFLCTRPSSACFVVCFSIIGVV